MRAVVFLGPSLMQRQAEGLIDAAFRPPAQRGDIYRALRDGFDTIVLIDGEFHGRPSVWQREIVEAVAEGAAVHGASSMGALRAAELHSLGMIGHGTIFGWYRDGVLDGDDEVALIYGPAELDYIALSEPLVNIRATLDAAVPSILTPGERDGLIAVQKALYFPRRTLDGLETPLTGNRREALRRHLAERRVNLKKDDAVTALKAVAAGDTGASIVAGRADVGWPCARLVAEGIVPSLRGHGASTITDAAGLSRQELDAAWRELSTLFFLLDWATGRTIVAGETEVEAEQNRFPAIRGLTSHRRDLALAKRALARACLRHAPMARPDADEEARRNAILEDWARLNGIERPVAAEGSLADWLVRAGPNHFGYFDWQFEVELAEAMRLQGRLS